MAKKVLLLINLGSPKSTSNKDVKEYLNEFLMDNRVINMPYILRYLLVKGIITRFRTPKSAEKYKSIWTDKGSPLIYLTEELAEKVENYMQVPTYMCMRYGQPNPGDVLKQIAAEHEDIEELVLFPLYPHYALSSYETAVEYVKDFYKESNYGFKLNIVDAFYNDKDYISALSESIKPYIRNKSSYDYILFSYHGIPERHLRLTDPSGKHQINEDGSCCTTEESQKYCYRYQVMKTTELVAKELNLDPTKYSISYQSRLGRDKWLEPNTVDILEDLPQKGIKNILVISPAFISDCLETLEEIEIEGEEDFLKAGGETLKLIPCLNVSDRWVEAMSSMVNKL